eukprot:scaffold25422_cov80-Phaeocystis_antarctica.AAC.2
MFFTCIIRAHPAAAAAYLAGGVVPTRRPRELSRRSVLFNVRKETNNVRERGWQPKGCASAVSVSHDSVCLFRLVSRRTPTTTGARTTSTASTHRVDLLTHIAHGRHRRGECEVELRGGMKGRVGVHVE